MVEEPPKEKNRRQGLRRVTGERRSFVDRREKDDPPYTPNRRAGVDRRQSRDRRKGTERRKFPEKPD